jgi:L-amino acid N-acyltransferase YncA
MTTTLSPLLPEHWPEVQAIYAEGLATGLAAFTADTRDWPDWDDGHLETGRFVAKTTDGKIAGWSALSPIPDT